MANRAGVVILSFNFNELSYAPEIASQMLKRQQAHALVQARATIVQVSTHVHQLSHTRNARGHTHTIYMYVRTTPTHTGRS